MHKGNAKLKSKLVAGFELDKWPVFIIGQALTNSHYVAGSRLSAWRVKFYRGSRPMNQSVTYRQNAAECYEAARILSEPRQKAKLLAMAQSWISLADLAERNSHLDRIDETPPRRESHIH